MSVYFSNCSRTFCGRPMQPDFIAGPTRCIILRTSASGSSGVSSFLARLERGLVAVAEGNERIEREAHLAPVFRGALVHAVHGAAQAVLHAGEIGRALVVVEEPPVGVFRHHLQPARRCGWR